MAIRSTDMAESEVGVPSWISMIPCAQAGTYDRTSLATRISCLKNDRAPEGTFPNRAEREQLGELRV